VVKFDDFITETDFSLYFDLIFWLGARSELNIVPEFVVAIYCTLCGDHNYKICAKAQLRTIITII
jgi:hypothetical protein